MPPDSSRSRCLVLLLLLLVLAPPHNALAAEDKPAGRQQLFDWLLRRLQSTGDTNSTDADTPDFAATASALTEQAVREANVRAAALARLKAFPVQQDSSSAGDGSSNGTSGDAGAAAAVLQLLQLQQQTASASTGLDSSRDDASVEAAGLQLLLHTIKEEWEAARSRQRQDSESGPDMRPSASEQWAEGLAAMARQYPSLEGFARLVSNNSALRLELAQTGQLPSILLVPTNAVLGQYLTAMRALAAGAAAAAAAAGADSHGGGSTTQDTPGTLAEGRSVTLEQLVDDLNTDSTADSLMLLRRHFIPARQPHLLDSDGAINRQLLERGSNPLVFTSLVLKTALGSYIQVSQLPQGPAAQRLADAVTPSRMAANSSTATASNTTTASNSAAAAPQLLHVGQGGSALARPFVLQPTATLVVPMDTVLTEHDEVVNRLTAARLRGAFGWAPEDEHALLSAVYLDAAASYWQQQTKPDQGADSTVVGGLAGFLAAGGSSSTDNDRQGTSRNTGSSDSSSNGSSNGGDGAESSSSGRSDDAQADNSQSSGGGDGTDSSSSGPGGRGRLRRLQQQADDESQSQASPAPAASSNTDTGRGGSANSNVSGPAGEGSGSGAEGPGSGVVSAFVAEARARQQQVLVMMGMSDALAANLMTTEAISAWVSAAVLNAAAVFDPDSLGRLPKVPAGSSNVSPDTNSSSRSSSVQGGRQSDWDCWLRNAGRQGRRSSSQDSSSLCPLVDWSSTCINAPCSPTCSSDNSAAALSTCPAPSAGNSSSSSSNSSSSSADSVQQAAQPQPGVCSSISNAWMVGLSPYQLFPSLGTPAANTYGGSSSSSGRGVSSSSDSDGGGSGRRRALRALREASNTNSTDGRSSSSPSPSPSSPPTSPPPPPQASPSQREATHSPPDSSSGGSSSTKAPPGPDDLAFLQVTQLAKLLADGAVTPQQLAAAFQGRMQQYNNVLHTVVTETHTLAEAQAAAAQQALAASNTPDSRSSSSTASRGAKRSLLMGVPYGLKDLFAAPGYPTSWGLSALRNRTIDTPSWAYSALSGLAGGVLLAKTATGELAWGDQWFDDVTTRNPWSVNTGSCGSSAGSAAGVAAGLLPFAIGSETWGSVVCPATTVGVTAFRPSGGTVPNNGLLQVSPTLDKTGVFCRQLLDCALVADALMDTQASRPADSTGSAAAGCCSSPAPSTRRLHWQDPTQAASFNYTAYQQQQLAGNSTSTSTSTSRHSSRFQPVLVGTSVFPATFQELPALSGLCIGYLHGTSTRLLSVLRSLSPACLKGPLPAPGNPSMVRDVLPTLMQAEVAISFEGLWVEGFIQQDNHWWPSLQLGQLASAATYLRAQQLRGLLLQETRRYFEGHGIDVLLKPARSTVGLDGLAALLDLPEVVLPVEMGPATFDDAEPVAQSNPGGDASGDDASPASSSSSSSSQRNPGGTNSRPGRGTGSGSGSGSVGRSTWTQPKVNTLIALPGADAAAIAVGAAFQSVTDVHLQRPPLPDPAGNDAGPGDRGITG